MITKHAALFTTALVLTAAIPLAAAAPPDVILLGTVHDMHLQPQFHYSLMDLRHQVEALHADAICGEITPEAYQKPMEGNFPVEAAYLSEIAPELHIKFVPTDWRVAWEWQRRASKLVPKDVDARASEIDRLQGEGAMGYKGSSLFDYVHSEDFLGLSDRKFEEINGEDTAADIASGAWHERNRRVVENCLDATAGAKRVVIAFGANHIAQLRRELTTQKVPFTIATRQFTPTGLGKIPDSVIARWRRNFENLKGIIAGTVAASRNDRETVKHNSRRIKELEAQIAAYTETPKK